MTERAERPSDSQFFAQRLFNAASGNAAKSIDAFSSWITAGAAAALGLLIVNLHDLSGVISPISIGRAALLLAWVIAVAVVEKAISTLVASTLDAYETGWASGRDAAAEGVELDFSEIFRFFRDATPFPVRWFVGRRTGLSAQCRSTMRLVLIQATTVVVQVTLVLSSAYELARDLLRP